MNLPAAHQGTRTQDSGVWFKERLWRKQERNGDFLEMCAELQGLFSPPLSCES